MNHGTVGAATPVVLAVETEGSETSLDSGRCEIWRRSIGAHSSRASQRPRSLFTNFWRGVVVLLKQMHVQVASEGA
jgi:hypothetical protein